MRLSVILPVFRQSDHIGLVLVEYAEALRALGLDFEVIVVVNGGDAVSRDACLAVAATERSVQVIFLEEAGWGRAVRAGLARATGTVLCYTNSARTSASTLVSLLSRGAADDGTVYMAMRRIREGWWRRAGSLLYNLQCRALFDLAIWDVNGTPKVFPRRFDRLLALTRDDDVIDLEFNLICRDERYPVVQLPVPSARRSGGRSTTNWRSAGRLYWGAFQVWRDSRRRV